MIQLLASLLLGVALLAGAPVASAQTDAKTAEELLRSSGMWQQLASIAPQVQAGFAAAAAQSGAKPTPGELERLSRVIDTAYAAERLRVAAVATLQAQTRADHVPALRRWYGSRIGKAITGLEEAASAEQTDPMAVAQEGATLLSAMQPARRAALEELVTVTRSAETLVQLTFDTALAAQQGLRSVTPDAPGTSAGELRAALEAQRPQLLQAFSGLSLASYAKAYTRLPTSELQQYLAFLKSAAGQHFTDTSLQAFTSALVEASAEMGRGLPGAKDRSNI